MGQRVSRARDYSKNYQVSRSMPKSTSMADALPTESISPSVMIPQHRLAQLLDQIKQSQISRCLYHNPSTALSLFTDHICDRNQFPLRTTQELNESDGEIYVVEFSHNGRYLATSGSSHSIIIYDTATWEVQHRLSDHSEQIVYFTWSPDDAKLITCCWDHRARVWDTDVGGHDQRS